MAAWKILLLCNMPGLVYLKLLNLRLDIEDQIHLVISWIITLLDSPVCIYLVLGGIRIGTDMKMKSVVCVYSHVLPQI